jgi:glycosyltransferase involved in cell wall biosynthesis
VARFILATADPLTQPAGEEFLRIAESLRDRGHEVVLSYPDENGSPVQPTAPEHSGGSLSVLAWPSAKPSRLINGLWFSRLVRRFRPDCVAGRRGALNWSIFLGRLFGVPVRIAWDDTLPAQWVVDERVDLGFRMQIKRRAFVYRCATKVVAASRASVHEMNQWYGVEETKCVVVGYGVSAPTDESRRSSDPTIGIMCLGRLEPSKNHALVIEALARLDPHLRNRCKLTIIGSGPLAGALAELVNRHGLDQQVELAGWISHDEAMRRLAQADVMVHSSVIDNFPFAIIEAMSRSVAIVATRVGGIPEMIEDGRQGILINEGDISGLARALELVSTDDELRARLGANARERFLLHYEMGRWVDDVAAHLLSDVVTATGSSA